MDFLGLIRDKYFSGKRGTQKRSPKEIIENEPNSEVEHAYVKFPGKEMVNVDEGKLNTDRLAYFDQRKVGKLSKRYKERKYSEIHTHIHAENDRDRDWGIPSYGDMKRFLRKSDVKTMIVAQQNSDTKEVEGYCVIRKKDDRKKDFSERDILTNILSYDDFVNWYISSREKNIHSLLKDICEKLDLQYKFMPAKGFKLQEIGEAIKFSKESSSLETKVAVIISVLVLSISIFISSNLTGFSVANFTTKGLNILGIPLFLGSLIYLAFILKRDKQK
jgi:hypothetical protein